MGDDRVEESVVGTSVVDVGLGSGGDGDGGSVMRRIGLGVAFLVVGEAVGSPGRSAGSTQ